MRLTITITADIDDDASDAAVVDLLGAISAQIDDDQGGIVSGYTMDAPHPAWQAPDRRTYAWADGFGRWHASTLGRPSDDTRDAARAAIIAELELRAGPAFDPAAVAVAYEQTANGRTTWGEIF